MASTAALELVIQLNDQASKGLDNVSKKGSFLKDAFSFATGGLIEKGIESIGGAVTGFFGDMMQESKDNQKGLAQLDAVLQSTGGSAGVSKDQVLGLVDSLSSAGGLSTATDDAVLGGENMLLTFTNIGKDVFPAATQTMLDMATAMNNGAAPSAEELSAQAIQLGKALNDPTKGLTALSRVGVSFTQEQKDQIKAMQDVGDTAGAQKIILAELGKEFGGSAAAAANTFDGQMAHLGGVFDNVKQSLGDKLLPILSDVMSFIGSPAVVGVIQTLADGLGNLLTGAIDLAKGAFEALSPIVQTVWGVIQPGLEFVRDNAAPILTGLSVAVLGLLVPGFIAWATTATAAAAATWAAIAPVLVAAAPFIALGAAIALLWVAVQNNFLGIGDIFNSVMSTIRSAVEPFWTEIQPKIQAAWDAVSSTIVNAWNFIQGLIVSGVQALMTAWDTNWGGIRTIVETAWNLITGIITVAWDIITGIINTALDLLSGDWGAAWQDIQDMLSGVWDTITGTILPNALNLIWTFLTDFLPKLVGQLGEWALAFGSWILDDVIPQLPGWLGNIASGLWTFLTETARNLGDKLINEWVPKLWNWITGPGGVMEVLPPKLGEILSGILGWILQTSSDLGNKIVDEWVPGLWNWITGPGGVIEVLPPKLGEIVSKIWSWISDTAHNIVDKMLAVGGGILDGLKQGIQNGWNQLVNWFTGLLQGMVNGVLSFFGIHSPSTVFADIGEQLPAGLKAGWEGKWPEFTTEIGDNFTVLRDGLNDTIPANWKPLGVAAAVAVVDGLKQGLPDAQQGADDWLNQISGGLSTIIPSTWKDLGVGAAVAVVDGLKSGSDAMFTSAVAVFDQLKAGLNTDIASKWPAIGVTSATLIATGFSQGFAAVASTAISLMDALWGEANDRMNEILDMLDRVNKYGSATGGNGSGNNDYHGGGGGGGGRGSGRGFASGGRPPVGMASWVGEHGKELFVPDVPGTILPHGMYPSGGGVVISGNSFYISGNDVGDIADQIVQELEYRMAVNERIATGQGRR